MPAGVTWGPYLRYTCAAFLSMLAGSQLVHLYYNPLEDMNTMIDREKRQLRAEYMRDGKADVDKPSTPDEPSATTRKAAEELKEGEQKKDGGC